MKRIMGRSERLFREYISFYAFMFIFESLGYVLVLRGGPTWAIHAITVISGVIFFLLLLSVCHERKYL